MYRKDFCFSRLIVQRVKIPHVLYNNMLSVLVKAYNVPNPNKKVKSLGCKVIP